MEIEIKSDAYDDGICLFMKRDCSLGFFGWMQYEKGGQACPCESCELFLAFKKSGKTLAEFRKYLRDIRGERIIDDFCEDMQVKFENK